MKIPSNNNWTQINDGDIVGVLNETKNITLDKTGLLRLSQKSVAHITDAEDVDFEQVLGIEQYGGDTYLTTDDNVFKGDLDGGGFIDTTGPGNDTRARSVVCYDRLYCSDNNDFHYYASGSWTLNQCPDTLSTANGVAHPMAVFDSLPTYKLAVGDANSVRTYSSAHAANSTVLALPEQYIVTSLAYRSGYLYVGTKTDDGQEARVFVWDGATANANYSVSVGASWIFALVPYKSTVAGITNEGELFVISGTEKIHLAGLPIYYAENKRWYSAVAATTGIVMDRGMGVVGDQIYIMIEGTITNDLFDIGMKDGVWIYDPNRGLYHYTTPTSNKIVRDTGLSVTNNVITTSAAHSLVTGDAVQFDGVSGLSGVSASVIYYAIVTGTDTLKIAGNRYDADQGNEIVITGTADAGDILMYAPNSDMGCLLSGNCGAVFVTNHRVVAEPLYSSDIIYGAEPNNESNVQISTAQAMVDSWNIGWFTTQKIYSDNIKENWHKVILFINGALLSNEKVIVKYRTQERAGLPTDDVLGTWSDATNWATTDMKIKNNVKAGDEVMIVRGRGQGRLAHITAVEISASTTTLTLDESIGNVGDVAYFVVTGYKKAQVLTHPRESDDMVMARVDGKGSWIQIKVELRGFGIEVKGIELISIPDKLAK